MYSSGNIDRTKLSPSFWMTLFYVVKWGAVISKGKVGVKIGREYLSFTSSNFTITTWYRGYVGRSRRVLTWDTERRSEPSATLFMCFELPVEIPVDHTVSSTLRFLQLADQLALPRTVKNLPQFLNPCVRYGVYKTPPVVPILSQINPVHC